MKTCSLPRLLVERLSQSIPIAPIQFWLVGNNTSGSDIVGRTVAPRP